jgi:hypothetical protein
MMMLIRLTPAAIFLLAVSAAVVAGQGMPKPRLGLIRTDDVTEKGLRLRMYTIEITNSSEFSDELFAASPDLPPCGTNANSSRTWINIYIDNGRRVYGWCAIHSNGELSSLKFNIPADDPQPSKFYVEFVDRREGKVIKSNKIEIVEE